jgi:hypothetical protein
LLPLIYDGCGSWRPSVWRRRRQTDATALVHEAYLRLVDAEKALEQPRPLLRRGGRGHARILVDNARRKKAEKHGGAVQCRSSRGTSARAFDDLLALDEALTLFEQHAPDAARLVKPVTSPACRTRRRRKRWVSAVVPPTASGRWPAPGYSAGCRNSRPFFQFPRAGHLGFSH